MCEVQSKPEVKQGRGRPKGSKNKPKEVIIDDNNKGKTDKSV